MLLLLSLLFLGTRLSSAVLPTVSPGIVTVDGRGWSHVGAFFTHKRVSLSAAASRDLRDGICQKTCAWLLHVAWAPLLPGSALAGQVCERAQGMWVTFWGPALEFRSHHSSRFNFVRGEAPC